MYVLPDDYVSHATSAIKRLKYCRHGVKPISINQSINQSINPEQPLKSSIKQSLIIYLLKIDKRWAKVIQQERQKAD